MFDLAKEVIPGSMNMKEFVQIVSSLRLNSDDPDIHHGISLRSHPSSSQEPKPTNTNVSPQEIVQFVEGGFHLSPASPWRLDIIEPYNQKYIRISDEDSMAATFTVLYS